MDYIEQLRREADRYQKHIEIFRNALASTRECLDSCLREINLLEAEAEAKNTGGMSEGKNNVVIFPAAERLTVEIDIQEGLGFQPSANIPGTYASISEAADAIRAEGSDQFLYRIIDQDGRPRVYQRAAK